MEYPSSYYMTRNINPHSYISIQPARTGERLAHAELIGGTYRVNGDGLCDGGFEWAMSSCGANYLSIDGGAHGQLHPQGGGWSGTTNAGCATTIDDGALTGTYQCPMAPPIAIQLTKTG